MSKSPSLGTEVFLPSAVTPALPQTQSDDSFFDLSEMLHAVTDELAAISKDKRSVLLFDGIRSAVVDDGVLYKFEVPEGTYLSNIEQPEIRLGEKVLEGEVLGIENQFARVILKQDQGEAISELRIEWSTKLILTKLHDHLSGLVSNPTSKNVTLARKLFSPPSVQREPPISANIAVDPNRNGEQRRAIASALINEVTFVWGPPGTGKTSTLGFVLLNLVLAGKRVLLLSNTNRAIDVAMQQTIAAYKALGRDWQQELTRYGRPYIVNDPELTSIGFDRQVAAEREKLEAAIQGKRDLLNGYRRLRDQLAQHSIQLQELEKLKADISSLESRVQTYKTELGSIERQLRMVQNPSGFGGLIKSIFGPSQEQLEQNIANAKSHIAKSEQSKAQLLIRQSELKGDGRNTGIGDLLANYEIAKQRIADAGGEAALEKDVVAATKVDEAMLLKQKKVIGATIAKAITNNVLLAQGCDTLAIDEASMVGLPYLAVLASHVRSSVVIAGDPQQLPPIAQSSTEPSRMWLQRDIYAHAARAVTSTDLFQWQAKNSAFAVFLDTQYRMPKALSSIINELFYNGRLKDGKSGAGISDRTGVTLIDTQQLHPTIKNIGGATKKFDACNPVHTSKIIALLKHLIIHGEVRADECGIVLPLNAAAQYTRSELKKAGMKNVEVGTVHTFQGREKDLIIFDTVMAGVGYTIRPFDEAKTGDSVSRLLNVALSRARNTLVVVADARHFETAYKGKIIHRLLNKLAEATPEAADIEADARAFDSLSVEKQSELLSSTQMMDSIPTIQPSEVSEIAERGDGSKLVQSAVEASLVKAPTVGAPPTIPSATSDHKIEKQVLKDGKRIVSLRAEVNHLYSRQKAKALFTPSIEGDKIASRLPFEVVRSESEFGSWIVGLYKYTYEATGGQKCDPIVNDKSVKSTKVLWEIRKLRNSFGHDTDQSEDAKENKIKVARIYNKMIGKEFPTKENEWISVQVSLMNRVIEWLEYLEGRVKQ